MLLLHGLSGSPLEMQYLGRQLRAAGFTVHNPAIPGCAFGTRADPFDTGTWQQWLAFAAGELEALNQEHGQVCVAGLCIGAVLALRLAIERPEQVRAMALISTTLAYDGWAMPWYRVLAPIAYHTPLRRVIAWPERHPYGLKNERLREWIVRAMDAHGASAAGAAYLPLSGIHEAHRVIKAVRRDVARASAPALVMHAVDDDVASTRSAEFVARHIGSKDVRTILYHDSYHILTLDNDKDAVAEETIGFFHRHLAADAEPAAAPADARRKRRLSIA
ncbi:MAG TPA: alpha/beta fold hydrolase [Burkholderiaceae bacterium]